MKTKNLKSLYIVLTALSIMAFVAGCKKDKDTANEDFQSEGLDIAQTEDISTGIDNTIEEAFELHGSGSMERNSEPLGNHELGCGSVTTDSATGTMTITFNNCIGPNGHVRNGQIIITSHNGGYWDPGASWDVTFNNFTIDGNPVTGSRHVENVGPASNGMTWNITASLTFTRPDATYRTWSSTRTRQLTQGYGDSIRTNNIYVINGTAAHADTRSGRSANITITNITRDLSCAYITAGSLNVVPSNRPARLIEFGNGACDDIATVTKNGVTHIIHLHP